MHDNEMLHYDYRVTMMFDRLPRVHCLAIVSWKTLTLSMTLRLG